MSVLDCGHPRAVKVLLWFLLSLAAGQACGPDFSPDVFVRRGRPDRPMQYVQGQLGIVQSSFPRADLMVAYRYLQGSALDAEEQKGWSPTYSVDEPESLQAEQRAQEPAGASAAAVWTLARATYPDAPAAAVEQYRPVAETVAGGAQYQVTFLNCGDDAFRTAAATLADRASRWGVRSPALADWLHAQDQVFANCAGGRAMPAAAPAGSPALLVSDRAYQIAAANFYSLGLDAATEQFRAIGRDRSSPWQPLGGYLAARSLVRQAFLARKDVAGQASYDPAIMRAAEKQLQEYLAGGPAPELRKAAEAKLAMVRIRIDPEQRAHELGLLIGGPHPDPNYAQDVKDLLWRLDAATSPPEAGSPIVDWVMTYRGAYRDAPQHAIEQWQRTRGAAWLVAALALASEPKDLSRDLLAAAAALPLDSPAWETATYHRTRLLLAGGQSGQARAVLQQALPMVQLRHEPSSTNAFRGLALLAAPTLAEFLAYAPRAVLLDTSQETNSLRECREAMKDPNRHYDCVESPGPEQFAEDAVGFLNAQAPLSTWLAAARSPALGPQLRQALATGGWTRAVLLGDSGAAQAFLPLLPAQLRTEAGSQTRLEELLVLARNPGLSPLLDAGSQRSYSYDFVESYRENWCYQPRVKPAPLPAPAFLSPAERKAGTGEGATLAPLRGADVGRQIVDYVQAHGDDPRAAEALFLVLRMIRYGCVEAAASPTPTVPGDAASVQVAPAMAYSAEAQQLLTLKQEASRLLRRRYATSPWTKKAAPFAG